MTVIDLLKARLDRDDAEPLSAGGTGDSNAPADLSLNESTGSDRPTTDAASADPTQVVTEANDRLKERQCKLLFGRHARLGVWGSVATALVVVSLLWPVTSHTLLLRWVALVVLTVAVRLILLWRHRTKPDDAVSASGWINRFDGTLFISGTVWGLGGILLPPAGMPIYSALVGFGIVALVAGAVVAFSTHVRSVFAFSTPALLPYAVYVLLVGNAPMVVLGGALLIFLGFVTSIALNAQQDFLRNFATEEDNMNLAAKLVAAQHVTKTLNKILETRVRQRTAALEDEIVARKREIDARRKTENRLRLSEEIVDTSLDLNSVVDRNYRYLTVNTGYVQAFGGTKESFIGKCIADLAGIEVFEKKLKPLIDRAVQGESVVSEYWLDYPKLGERYMEAHYEPYRDAEGIAGVIINVRNITHRKHAEDALRDSESDYKALFDNAPLGIARFDLQGQLMRANPAFHHIFGYRLGENDLVGKTVKQLTHPDDAPLASTYLERLLAEPSGVFETEKRYVRKDGSVIWGQIVVSLVRDASGDPLYTVGQVQDITARKQTEDTLNRGIARYELAEQVGQLGYWEWDEKVNRLISCSEQYARIFDMTVEEVLAASSTWQGVRNLIHPDDRERYARVNNAAVKKLYGIDIEYRIITSTGAVRHVHEVGHIEFHEGRKALRSFGTLQDITARTRAESELQRTDALYQEAARLGKLGHWEWDEKAERLLSCSQQYADIFEMTIEEALEASSSIKGDLELAHPDDRARYRQADLEASERKMGLDLEYRIVTSSGATRWVNELGETEVDAEGNPGRLFGTLQDITEQKHAEQALQESAKWAATGSMVARIAHEINNPLAGIKNSFLLLKGGIPRDYEYYDYADRVERELDRISTLIRQLLDQYRPVEHNERDIEFAELVDDVVLLLEPMSREHQVSVMVQRPAGIVVRIRDSVVRQALFNVLTNAIKFSMPGDEVRLTADSTTDTITISVADHGPGINPAEAERIFEAFYSGGKPNTPGLGLGLSVSRNLLENIGGLLTFESTPGVATTFTIEAPHRLISASE